MSTHATGRFEIKGWDEQAINEIDGAPKLTRASVTTAYRGDIQGESTLEYLMFYGDNTATFIGLERVIGRLGDRSGAFVLRHDGAYVDNVARGTVTVVPGSGTSDLRGLRGEGAFRAGHEELGTVTLDYDFA
jgi:hypothetical protein